MLVDVTQTQSHDLVSSQESALQEATQRITTEVDVILSALAAAVTSSTSLNREIVRRLSSPIEQFLSDRNWIGDFTVHSSSCCIKTRENRDGKLNSLAKPNE